MVQLPSGTVTFLFSDVEGSTQLLERHGAAMGGALARHHALFEQIIERHGGAIFETVGDAVYAAFPTAAAAVAAALDGHRALAAEDWGSLGRLAVRIALHSGAVEQRGDHYFGPALFRAARLQALGYGEQTLLSAVTARLTADALPTGASLRDLGSHRLKDLGEAEQVFQLVHPDLRAEFPALKSLDAHPHNLPIQLSSFVGREAELAFMRELLGKHRLVTLLGPGGIGKTRLALQVAAEQVEHFGDGVFFADLAGLRDPELVPGAIATTLGLREQAGEPIATTLTEQLTGKEMLLVLDNLEQVLPAGRSLAELLRTGPQLRVLATSRAPLRIRGEHEYWLSPLATGAPDRLDDKPPAAVTLFLERARAIKPDLDVTAETGPLIAAICARLDGLPLAIELAAARLRLFGLTALLERLDRRLPLLTGGARDLPERQRTLRAAIAWSEELLSEPERHLFARLGVFVGAFTFEAAESVAAPELDVDALEGLTALLEHSLLGQVESAGGEPRYAMLETIREYAAERLEARGEADAVRERHAIWLAEYAEGEMERYAGPEHGRSLDLIAAYIDDFRSALAWAFERSDSSVAVRMALALSRYWDERDTSEGIRWLERAASLSIADTQMQLRLTRRLGWVHSRRGESEAAFQDLQELLRLGRAAGDPEAVSSALSNLAFESLTWGRLEDARRHLDELDRLDYDEGPWARAITGRLWGRLEAESGNFEIAEGHFVRSQEDARRSGDPGLLASVMGDHALADLWRGDTTSAKSRLTESARLARQVDFKGVLGPALVHLAVVAAREGNASDARAALTEALEVLDTLGGTEWLEDLLDAAAWLSLTNGDAPAAAPLLAAAAVRWERIESHARSSDRQWHNLLAGQVQAALATGAAPDRITERRFSDAEAIRYAVALLARRRSK
jgi:predicted ATPase/class 3 adenylate cyclase